MRYLLAVETCAVVIHVPLRKIPSCLKITLKATITFGLKSGWEKNCSRGDVSDGKPLK